MTPLGTKTAFKIFNVLADHPLQEFKEVELIQQAKTGKGAASDAMREMVKDNIVVAKTIGKAKILTLNVKDKRAFLLKNLCDLEKIRVLPQEKRAALALFSESIRDEVGLMIVFGSTIAGTATPDSDVDVLIVAKRMEKINQQRKNCEEIFALRFNLHTYTPREAKTKLATDKLLQQVLLRGVLLQGYDFGQELFSLLGGPETIERPLFLLKRARAASQNYIHHDYATAEEIVQRTVEQLIFHILTERHIPYQSKKDAWETIQRLPEGKILKKIKQSPLKEQITLLEELVKVIVVDAVLQEGGHE